MFINVVINWVQFQNFIQNLSKIIVINMNSALDVCQKSEEEKCQISRYASLGPLTFREAAVSFYFFILVSLWFFQVSKCLYQTSFNFELCLLGDGDKVNCGECHHYVYRLCLWNLEFIFLYFNFHCFALFAISSVGARIHPWVGRLLCSA